MKKLIAENTNVGVATKDYGTFFAENLELDNVEYCITAYSKKQEFSGGKADIKKLIVLILIIHLNQTKHR